jgi:membrane protein implicated in regulation of membrane protease activity
MQATTVWWVIAGFLFSMEVLSKSYHFLFLAAGAVGAAVGASFGLAQQDQLLLASGIGGGLVWWWQRRLMKRGVIEMDGYHTTGLGDLDVGEEVSVGEWEHDGTAHVKYRGSQWPARHHGPHVPRSGPHRILAVESTHLVLEPLGAH